MARESGLTVDVPAFEKEMEKQRQAGKRGPQIGRYLGQREFRRGRRDRLRRLRIRKFARLHRLLYRSDRAGRKRLPRTR